MGWTGICEWIFMKWKSFQWRCCSHLQLGNLAHHVSGFFVAGREWVFLGFWCEDVKILFEVSYEPKQIGLFWMFEQDWFQKGTSLYVCSSPSKWSTSRYITIVVDLLQGEWQFHCYFGWYRGLGGGRELGYVVWVGHSEKTVCLYSQFNAECSVTWDIDLLPP